MSRAAATAHLARAIAALLAGALWPVWAGDGGDGLPELRRIMRGLDEAAQAAANGVAREDWTQVAEIAPRIADHPQPPLAEKLRILALVGRDSARFRGYDGQIREAARSLQEAAKRKEGQAAAWALADMQRACDACHATFRGPIQEHYPERRRRARRLRSRRRVEGVCSSVGEARLRPLRLGATDCMRKRRR